MHLPLTAAIGAAILAWITAFAIMLDGHHPSDVLRDELIANSIAASFASLGIFLILV